MSGEERLAHFPVAFFSVVMGLSGLTLVWQHAARLLAAPAAIGAGLAVVTVVTFVVLAGFYALKMLRHPAAVREELEHPVRLSFFPAISISLILLGTLLLELVPPLAHGLWAIGTLLHLSLTLYVAGCWMHHERYEIAHINPAWFIPAVGNILVPLAGIPLGYPAVSWFFFSIGLLFWIVLLTIVFYRMFFHAPLPARLLPTLFIMIAPPAVGFVAWTRLVGQLDAMGLILVNIGLFLTLLLATQARRFAALPFFLSFWAYSFPLAAITIATFTYHELTGAAGLLWLGTGLLGVTTLVIAWLTVLTLKAAREGRICVPEA